MKIQEVRPLEIPEVKVVRYQKYKDNRGFFSETFRESDFNRIPDVLNGKSFVQSNESFSNKSVIRGLHFQWNPYMGKLVRTVYGHMVDIVLDIRLGSETFGKAIMYDMKSHFHAAYSEWIWVPAGFAHGNYFKDKSVIQYFCSGEYSEGCEACICPLAEDIDWSLCNEHLLKYFKELTKSQHEILSEKDRAGFTIEQWTKDPRSANFVFPIKEN